MVDRNVQSWLSVDDVMEQRASNTAPLPSHSKKLAIKIDIFL